VSLPPAVGIFIVRAWYEDDQFRARVTCCVDVRVERPTEITTADFGALVWHLNRWFEELAQRAERSNMRRDMEPDDRKEDP